VYGNELVVDQSRWTAVLLRIEKERPEKRERAREKGHWQGDSTFAGVYITSKKEGGK
jgi:hypothetical protein